MKSIAKLCKYVFMAVFTAIAVGPILWAFLSSFKTYAEIKYSAFSLTSYIKLEH